MRHATRFTRTLTALGSLAVAGCGAQPGSRGTPSAQAPAEAARPVFTHALPPLDGSRLEATLVEVSYAPGGGSAPHSHPCAVIGYVISGALRSGVNDEPATIYHAGESFYEPPGSRHMVSANASTEDPVRFLAYFTCDTTRALSTPLAGTDSGRRSAS